MLTNIAFDTLKSERNKTGIYATIMSSAKLYLWKYFSFNEEGRHRCISLHQITAQKVLIGQNEPIQKRNFFKRLPFLILIIQS